ncbi:putative secreted protein [Streptomyces davaonensis JCM 4913]|uniref:Putative secreted protein n=1 Tax=Streptomyces davaonensis (strain DSM 101723 / JCM 4913 / KCC S-0913 / 768) TaxID=1214101 RepID=K4R6E1_STRDJ|nr:hypothetical protein [Streptomyces davaonensis]CCK28279.1 putative secreted protein [Streptomyces davaonensis JCM 4913]
MKRNRVRIGAAAVATAGVVTGVGLWIDALETGHADDDGSRGTVAAQPKTSKCVGTKPATTAVDNPDDTPLYRLLDDIDRLGQNRFAHSFTGLSVDEDDNAADLYRIPSASFDDAVCDAAEKGVTVRIHDTDTSRADLDALAGRISEDMNRWDGTFQLREVGVDARGWVSVGVDDPDTAEPVLHDTFGDERHIRVVHVEQAHLD